MDILSQKDEIFATCPGKILISGGYSILTDDNIGMSLALDARFYVTSALKEEDSQQGVLINIISPQIKSEWTYQIHNLDGNLKLTQTFGNKNSFLESILQVFFCYVASLGMKLTQRATIVKILHDKDFYSEHSLAVVEEKTKKFPNFDPTTLKKTGLGSSACLIVSVMASMLHSWRISISDIEKKENKSWVHLLAQIANVIAQNKIGSGFDVSTAVYGSQVFQKLPQEALSAKLILSIAEMRNLDILQKEMALAMSFFINFEKNIEQISKIDLKVILMDFSTGSDTRILVPKVKEYLSKAEENKDFYKESNAITNELKRFFEKIENMDLRGKNEDYRNCLKKIGVCSNVEIEPDIVTIILDYLIMNDEKIEYCICPGAGGYDAACFLLKENSEGIKDFECKLAKAKTMIDVDIIRKNYDRKKHLFIRSFEEVIDQLKDTKINLFEIQIAREGLKFTCLNF